jgi:PAS domain S-box-containing protein
VRLLIVDDDGAVRRLVTNRLAMLGVAVTSEATGSAALAELRHTSFDVVILDLALPDRSGFEILHALRELEVPPHVIILSAAGSETDRVQALELGADDYVVKPFFVRELTARVLAVGRRRDAAEDRALRHGRIVIDLAARRVTVDQMPIELEANEFDLLAFLAARPGHAFSAEELPGAVWQPEQRGGNRLPITEYVRRLRAKIEEDPRRPKVLKSVRGVGYLFDPTTSEQANSGGVIRSAPAPGSEGIFVLVEGRIVAVDEVGVAMMGVAGESDLLNRELHDLVAPQSLIAANLRQRATAAGQSPGAQVMAVKRADTTEIFVEVSSSRTDWNGRPARRLTMHPSTDPSVRLRRLVTGVFSEVSDAVIITDCHFNVRSWNRAAERLYGWAESEVLGRHLFEVLPFDDAGEDAGAWIRTLEEEGRSCGDRRQFARDGSVVRVAASATLLRDDDEEPTAIAFVNRRVVWPVAARVGPRAVESTSAPDPGIVADMRRALTQGEFVVHYQPVVALNDHHIVTVEALVRWNHPERGLLTPASFIGVAEHSGLILDLGRAVLESSFRQTATWRADGIDLTVAVNLSTRQFANDDLVADITEMLSTSALDPKALWLEITETALVEDIDQANRALQRLAAMGVGIAIDDFGTGWASLTYLKHFPVHALKIDQSFVAGVGRNAHDSAIARSVISLGNELDLLVIAEGVETTRQEAALKKMGCAIGQGYLFGPPVPAAEVPTARAHRL